MADNSNDDPAYGKYGRSLNMANQDMDRPEDPKIGRRRVFLRLML